LAYFPSSFFSIAIKSLAESTILILSGIDNSLELD
jgi:hypothetical protein